MRELGFEILLNSHKLTTVDRGRLLLAGVTDYSSGAFLSNHTSSPIAAKRGAPEHESGYTSMPERDTSRPRPGQRTI